MRVEPVSHASHHVSHARQKFEGKRIHFLANHKQFNFFNIWLAYYTHSLILSACVFVSCSGVNINMQVSPENLLGTVTLSEYFRSCFHIMHYVTFIFLEIIYIIFTVA